MPTRTRRRRLTKTLWVPPDLVQRCLTHAEVGQRVRVKHGEVLYRQGDVDHNFFLIIDGQIKISVLRSDGREVILDIVDAGGLCGEGAAIDGLPRFSTATAITNSMVIRIDARHLRKIFAADPELMVAFFRVTALKQRMLAFRLSQSGQSSSEDRIMELFRYILRSMPPEERRRSLLNLTHEQIAALIGASRITVTRAMGRLRAAGLVETHAGQIRLLAPL